MRIISISLHHDSSVCVLNDGVVEAFYKEERYSRQKRDGLPYLAFEQALANLKGPVDHVCFANPLGNDDLIFPFAELIRKKLGISDGADLGYQHHMQHANLAFWNSRFNQAVAIVVDRVGSFNQSQTAHEAQTVFYCSRSEGFRTMLKQYWSNSAEDTENSRLSICRVYETAGSSMNVTVLDGGKIMGLAAWGTPNAVTDRLFGPDGRPRDELFEIEDYHIMAPCYRKGLPRLQTVTKENYQAVADYAWAVQNQTQEQMARLVAWSRQQTGLRHFVISGGYGLNVVANKYLRQTFPDCEFWFEPLSDDTGITIGAAQYLYYEQTGRCPTAMPDTFVHGTDHDLSRFLDLESVTVDQIAQDLRDFKAVAVFQGRAEAGPRALGHRSILYSPLDPDARDRVNDIKKREWYRPFAAMVLEEDADQWFDMAGKIKSPNMTESFMARPLARQKIPGVIHVDGSCRIQTVDRTQPFIYDLLLRFRNLTGAGVLLNTSLNLAGEPLVETPDQALEVLSKSSLDTVWFPEISRWIQN